MISRIVLFCGVLGAAFAAAPLQAQLRTIPRALRDSLAHPTTAQGAEAMRFDHTSVDMGRLDEDQAPPSRTFRWTNTGATPLVITHIQTTCGCITTDWSSQPVHPDKEGSITAIYRPKGHPGSFTQRIFVYTQLSDKYPTAILNLSGLVEAHGLSTTFPVTMGDLQLSRQQVTFDGRIGSQQANIACYNGGDTTLRPSCERELLPQGFSLVCEPATLEPRAEGTLIIRYEPPTGSVDLPPKFPLIINGLGLPPSKSSILIVVETK